MTFCWGGVKTILRTLRKLKLTNIDNKVSSKMCSQLTLMMAFKMPPHRAAALSDLARMYGCPLLRQCFGAGVSPVESSGTVFSLLSKSLRFMMGFRSRVVCFKKCSHQIQATWCLGSWCFCFTQFQLMVDSRCLSPACKTSPNHQSTTTVLVSWYEVFLPICFSWFSLIVDVCIMTKYLHFSLICPNDIAPKVLWFVQMQLCICDMTDIYLLWPADQQLRSFVVLPAVALWSSAKGLNLWPFYLPGPNYI